MTRLDIPDFDGAPVDLAHNAFSGSDETPPMILDPGEEAYLIVRVTTSAVAIKDDRFGRRVRVQSLRVSHSMAADDESIARVKAEIKRQQDEAAGQTSLDGEIDDAVEDDDDA
jgi:hypothetical protein